MKKRIKLFFYIFSALALGGLTIVEIVSSRSALIANNGKEPEAALQQVKTVVGLWAERKPFSFGQGITPVTPSATKKITPTALPVRKESTPSSSL